ncbi:MAG TPA: HNH endonuclease family protein [Nocardioidaceae bacterium]|nr:HNH endonuclease family protein [Nocardioidaceae bacterium]
MRAVRVAVAGLLAVGVASTWSAGAEARTSAADLRPQHRAANDVVRLRLRAAVRSLPVGRERRAGYDRDKFNLWIDADGDCLDTRAEVLTEESLTPVTGDCSIETGRWYSYYDAVTWTRASDVDIDHLVPLAEAWDSGARTWTSKTRERYANDLGDRRTLVAVTDNVNESKGDQDIAEWLPDHGRCRYVREWTAVKTRWSLRVDRREKQAMKRLAGGCPNRPIRVRMAVVRHQAQAASPARAQPRAGPQV